MFKWNRGKKRNGSEKNGKAGTNQSEINRQKHVQKMIEQNQCSQAFFIPMRAGDMR